MMNIIWWIGSQLKSNDNDNTNNIVRRSKSVVIQCQSNNEKIFHQPFPHPATVTIGDKPSGDSDNIKENLDDIKIEIEKLIFQREEIMRENSLLKFYKVVNKTIKWIEKGWLKIKRKSFKIQKNLLDDSSFKTINKINKFNYFSGCLWSSAVRKPIFKK